MAKAKVLVKRQKVQPWQTRQRGSRGPEVQTKHQDETTGESFLKDWGQELPINSHCSVSVSALRFRTVRMKDEEAERASGLTILSY